MIEESLHGKIPTGNCEEECAVRAGPIQISTKLKTRLK